MDGLGCMFKAICLLVGPGPVGECPPWGSVKGNNRWKFSIKTISKVYYLFKFNQFVALAPTLFPSISSFISHISHSTFFEKVMSTELN